MNGLRMIETIKASAAESDYFTKWSGQFVKTVNAQQELGAYTRALNAAPVLLQTLNVTLVLTIGSLRVMDGQLTIGMLIAFQYLMAGFLGPVNQLVGVGGLIQQTHGDMNRIDDVLRYQKAPHVTNGSREVANRSAQRLRGALELQGLTFGYSRYAPPLFEDFSMRVDAGEWVALVGSSGCGKSTLARLIAGTYQPWTGSIVFDGLPREAYARSAISNSVAVVDQDVLLFKDSVAANLSLWDESLPHQQIVRAAEDARIHDVIMTRHGEYSSELAEGGRNMSGGQRQRLEIARALALDPSFLILDEATSALDPTTEREVMDNIRRRGCSCLVVAHRLSTIRDCDEIILLDRGSVVERGKHEDLMAAGRQYTALVSAS
jgi:ABC-type bacteriocin/lantibiotic exporter with double-glycine peptidase domain